MAGESDLGRGHRKRPAAGTYSEDYADADFLPRGSKKVEHDASKVTSQLAPPKPNVGKPLASATPSNIVSRIDVQQMSAALHKATQVDQVPLAVLAVIQRGSASSITEGLTAILLGQAQNGTLPPGQLYYMPPDLLPIPVGGAGQPPLDYFERPDSYVSKRLLQPAAASVLRVWFARHFSGSVAAVHLDPESKAWLAKACDAKTETVGNWIKSEQKNMAPYFLQPAASKDGSAAADDAADDDGGGATRPLQHQPSRQRQGEATAGAMSAASSSAAAAGPNAGLTTLQYVHGVGYTTADGTPMPVALSGYLYDPVAGQVVHAHAHAPDDGQSQQRGDDDGGGGAAATSSPAGVPLAVGFNVAIPPALASQGVSSLVLGSDANLIAFDVHGNPMGLVPYGPNAEAAMTAAQQSQLGGGTGRMQYVPVQSTGSMRAQQQQQSQSMFGGLG